MPSGAGYEELNVSVNRLFAEEATVIVWRNHNMPKVLSTGHFGHAAIMLRGAGMASLQSRYKYISWWPADGTGKEDALRAQGGFASRNYHDDMAAEISERAEQNLARGAFMPRRNQLHGLQGWGAASDAQVSVPGLGDPTDEAHPIGLCLKRMHEWYEEYVDGMGTYRLASKTESCAGVALVALIEGGAMAFCKPPSMLIMAEPKEVEVYARSVQRAILDFNRKVVRFKTASKLIMHRERSRMIGVTGFTTSAIYRPAEWHRISSIGSSRSSLVRKIDEAVADYHKYNWTSDFAKKFAAAVRILEKCAEHVAAKPTSKRAFPITRLGLQAHDILRKLRLDTNPA